MYLENQEVTILSLLVTQSDFNKYAFSIVVMLGTEIIFISTSFFFHITHTENLWNFFLCLS